MITIQVKEPYVSVYRSGMRVTYGKTVNVSPEDPRVMFWLENGYVEVVESPKVSPPKDEKHPITHRKK